MNLVFILAGGKGKRLWPLSRESKPKQFLKIGKKSLLVRTYERCFPFVSRNKVYVVTNQKFVDLVGEETGLPGENIIGEPFSRNTACAIGLAAVRACKIDKKAVMVVLPADHIITKKEIFLSCLGDAAKIAKLGKHLVTLGIPPTFPATGYGYIRAEDPFSLEGEKLQNESFTVGSFTEKPDEERAKRYLKEGSYFWNSGMFIFRADKILKAIKRYMPQLYSGLNQIRAHLDRDDSDQVTAEVYKDLPSTSIDYGIMERCKSAVVIPADVGWNDVGDWTQMEKLMEKDKDYNAVDAKHLGVATKNSIIYSVQKDKLIATLGADNLVVVDTKDALLVMDKSRSQDLKEIVKEVEEPK